MDTVTALPLGALSASGILAITILLVLRGYLIPRKVHEDRMTDKDAQIQFYQEALRRESERNGVLADQVETLMEVARTAEHVFLSIPAAANRRIEGSRDEVSS